MTETFFRTFGGVVGLVGVVLVAYELDAAIGEYAPPAFRRHADGPRIQRLKGWAVRTWRRLLSRQPEGVTIQAQAASTVATAGTTRAMVDPPDRSYDDFDTDEERIRYLFDRAASANTWIGVIRERAKKDRSHFLQRRSASRRSWTVATKAGGRRSATSRPATRD